MNKIVDDAGAASAGHRLFAYPPTPADVPERYPDQWWFRSACFGRSGVTVDGSTRDAKYTDPPRMRLYTEHGELWAGCTPQLLREMAATLLAAADHIETLPSDQEER